MKNKTWDSKSIGFIETPKEMQQFFNEINEICKKYNLSISHEDDHGAFIIESYDEANIEWLENASKNY
jgi:hypothetical protein